MNDTTLDELLENEAISREQMEEMEDKANDNSRGLQRRLVLLACATSLNKLAGLKSTEPDAFNEMLKCVEAFHGHAEGLVVMAKTACNRLRIANMADSPPGESNLQLFDLK